MMSWTLYGDIELHLEYFSDISPKLMCGQIFLYTVKNFGEITPISYLGFTNLV